MKIIHTADWHIGQTFHEYDRSHEHQQFLNWLEEVIEKNNIAVLIVSGDVFDSPNPSANSIKIFYHFLRNITRQNTDLQVIISAGNHDSAARLESPKPLLEHSKIHIVGTIDRKEGGAFDLDKMVIPIYDKTGTIKLWCMAIPFLRMGDYPVVENAVSPYSEGVAALYKEVYEYALTKKESDQGIIALGHLHTLNAEKTDQDRTEREIMGGVEFVSVTAFNENIIYTALGHIHKAQRIGGRENVRYSGSPIPMSFSEIKYKHQVLLLEIEDITLKDIKPLEVPVTIDLLRVPETAKPLTEVLKALENLPEKTDDINLAPYLEVKVLLDGPEPALRYKIETAIANKYVRLAKIDVKYPAGTTAEEIEITSMDKLEELAPLDVFKKIYTAKFNQEIPPELTLLFNQVVQEVGENTN